MIGWSTGASDVRACKTCGLAVKHSETETHDGRHSWKAAQHPAPCGAPCIGGGVRPIPHDELPPGVSGIAHAHRADGCGSEGCRGGREVV